MQCHKCLRWNCSNSLSIPISRCSPKFHWVWSTDADFVPWFAHLQPSSKRAELCIVWFRVFARQVEFSIVSIKMIKLMRYCVFLIVSISCRNKYFWRYLHSQLHREFAKPRTSNVDSTTFPESGRQRARRLDAIWIRSGCCSRSSSIEMEKSD